jgi:hypothetical protein
MGIEFKLTDRELPASPAFVTFLAGNLARTESAPEIWPDQTSEELARMEATERELAVAAAVERVMNDPVGRQWVTQAYTLLIALLTGDLEQLTTIQSRFHFIGIIGIPRTGGSYLTAELYRSLGMDPHTVPGALAHDSFPEAGPFELTSGINSWIRTLKTIAEYLTMVEVFFAGRRPRTGKIVVPKKLTQGIYAAGMFQRVLGPMSEYVLTVRHPVAACVSTYEKSGGLPADGRLAVRSNIEQWCRRDLEYAGCSAARLASMDYFDAYLRYWEQYHLLVPTSGLARAAQLRIVGYGADTMRSLAQHYHDSHGSGLRAAAFHVSDTAKRRHPDWVERARPAIERVGGVWRASGLAFPADEIAGCV